MNKARCEFYKEFINTNSSDQRKLFRATKRLLRQSNDVPFPPFNDKLTFANNMGSFFVKKITNIHDKLDLASVTTGAFYPTTETLSEFQVQQLIVKSAKKSCALDPMPTKLVSDCLDVLLPVITKIINLSLETAILFPGDWKEALVCPLLKKDNLDLIFENYRPISNLHFISKLTVKSVCDQLHSHMSRHCLYPLFQSSYRKHHSTETALLKVKNDILLKMNSQHVILLVLLDLSAAFDTVDHSILMKRLQSKLGISGKALD